MLETLRSRGTIVQGIKSKWPPMSKQFLLEQIVRAKRFAAAMNTDGDREKFEKLAACYKSELDAAETTEGQPSVAATEMASSRPPAAPREAVAAKDENGVLERGHTASSDING